MFLFSFVITVSAVDTSLTNSCYHGLWTALKQL